MFFDNWLALGRIIIVGTLAYCVLIFWLRVSGKRTLSKWNAFDFVITVALGSTLATVLLSKNVTLTEGILAFALVIALQFIITWLAVRSPGIRRLIKSDPTILLDQGQFIASAMKSQRVTESEIFAAVRSAGIAALEEVEAVVLETDGSFSVIKRSDSGSRSALTNIPA